MRRYFPRRAARFQVLGFPANILDLGGTPVRTLVARARRGLLEAAPLLVYFGHINAGRGLECLLEALARLAAGGLKPQLALMSQFDPVNDDYHRALVALARHLGLEGQITFTGRLEAEAVSAMLAAADACVLPFPDGASFKNGTLAAAIEHGVPTVSTVSPLTEPALAAASGLLLGPPADVGALAGHLRRVLTDQTLVATMRRAQLALRAELSWDSYIARRLAAFGGSPVVESPTRRAANL
jgi:glycosyltransferase involved in cell wall biosynthesis